MARYKVFILCTVLFFLAITFCDDTHTPLHLLHRHCLKCDVPACVQETFFIPSSKGSTPKGKLYSRVCNLLCKKRALGGTTQRVQCYALPTEIANWEELELGCKMHDFCFSVTAVGYAYY